MRGGFVVELSGGEKAFGALEPWLVNHGYRVTRPIECSRDDDASVSAAPLVRILHLTADSSIKDLSARLAHIRSAGVATAAYITPGDTHGLSAALAVGCDDVVELADDDRVLARQLDRLYELARTRREIHLREEAARALVRGKSKRPAGPVAARLSSSPLRVLLAGPPAQPKVRLADALGKATISFADSYQSAVRMIGNEPMDLLVLSMQSGEALRSLDKVRLPRQRNAPFVVVLADPAVHAGLDLVPWMSEHHIADVLSPTLPVEQLRLRLEHWHQIGIGKRRLLSTDGLVGVPLDAITGSATQEFLTAYLDLRRRREATDRPALVRFSFSNLWQTAERCGYAMATELLAEMAQITSNAIRLLDLVAYCGNGHFLVSVDAATSTDLESIASRVSAQLESELAGLAGASPRIEAIHAFLSPDEGIAPQLAELVARPCMAPPANDDPHEEPAREPVAACM